MIRLLNAELRSREAPEGSGSDRDISDNSPELPARHGVPTNLPLPSFNPGRAVSTGQEPEWFQDLLRDGEGGPVRTVPRGELRPISKTRLSALEREWGLNYLHCMEDAEIIAEVTERECKQLDRIFWVPKADDRSPRNVFAAFNANLRRGHPSRFPGKTIQRIDS